jgi:hypothetical protein
MNSGQTPSRKSRGIIGRFLDSNRGRHIFEPIITGLDMAGGLAIKTKIGARLVGLIVPRSRPVLCTACFTDHGLRMDADRIGIVHALPCPNCRKSGTKKLTPDLLKVLASQFFVRGSVRRFSYGSAPLVQFNELRFQDGNYIGPSWLRKDIELISEKGGIGFFHYGPRLWMLGEVEPLKDLQDVGKRNALIERILKEYPERTLPTGEMMYRLRVNPKNPAAADEYDSPPDELLGRGRLDSPAQPVLYCSQDIEGCVHECRVTVEDELYLALLKPTRDLRLLDLTAVLHEEHVTEFESLDMAVHMLFFAPDHSYEISRAIAIAAHEAGFDGLLYPSYFSQVRSGAMPFETAYGISVRRFRGAAQYAKAGIFSNVALFGRPVGEGALAVTCVDRLVLHKVQYEVRFGPAPTD